MKELTSSEVLQAFFTVFASVIYVYPLNKREPFHKRGTAVLVSLFFGVFLLKYLMPETLTATFIQQCLFLAFLSGAAYACAVLRKSAAVYVAIWGLSTERFAYSLWIALWDIFPEIYRLEMLRSLLLLLLYLLPYVLIFFTLARKMPKGGTYDIGPRQMSSAVLIWLIMEFLTLILIYTGGREQWGLVFLAILLAQFYCLTVLYVQTELFKKSALEKELLTMNLLWQQQKEQYQLTRENIELINRTCHDLKHQIKALRMMGNDDSKEKYLKELEQSVQIYDAIVKTGNEVLDTILTEKSLFCEAHGIKINCVVDGDHLGFLDPVDLYAILGNALDNAIESVSGMEDQNKRLIDLAIFTREKFLVINISNPLEGKLTFRGGLPVTTKKDKGYHGYGLRSIRHNVQQYGGYMNVSAEHGIFILKMIIPLPKEA